MGLQNLFSICLFVGLLAENPTKYTYKFRTARYIIDAPNRTKFFEVDVNVCELPADERLQICKGALEEEVCQENNVRYNESLTLGEEKFYEVKLSGIFHKDKKPAFYLSACMCPTTPPIYLEGDSDNGTDISVYVDLQIKKLKTKTEFQHRGKFSIPKYRPKKQRERNGFE